jgi:hypothetical protein
VGGTTPCFASLPTRIAPDRQTQNRHQPRPTRLEHCGFVDKSGTYPQTPQERTAAAWMGDFAEHGRRGAACSGRVVAEGLHRHMVSGTGGVQGAASRSARWSCATSVVSCRAARQVGRGRRAAVHGGVSGSEAMHVAKCAGLRRGENAVGERRARVGWGIEMWVARGIGDSVAVKHLPHDVAISCVAQLSP